MELSLRNCQLNKRLLPARVIDLTYSKKHRRAKYGGEFETTSYPGYLLWGAKYAGMAWSRDPRILRKMEYCLLGSVE